MDRENEIPILNIYYLLIYAWNCLEESEIVSVSSLNPTSLVDLFGHVLAKGISHLLKQGLDRGYVTIEEETSSPRGRINIDGTITRLLHKQAKLQTRYDVLSYDVLHNQILKATVSQLVKSGSLSKEPHDALSSHLRRLGEVSTISVTSSHFRRLQLHSNRHFYAFLMRICELIHENLLIGENAGESKFRNFVRDERKMRRLFEAFVLNFYDREQKQYKVKREVLKWSFASCNDESNHLLPWMRTDTSLTSETPPRKIIIETKFLPKALVHHHGKELLRSAHLYQLYAYLQHSDHQSQRLEGILLYPTVNKPISSDYSGDGITLKVRTINLANDWRTIKADLLTMIE